MNVSVVCVGQKDTEIIRREVGSAVSRAIKKGYDSVLVTSGDPLAITIAEDTIKMVEEGELVVYHPKESIATDNGDRGDRWVYPCDKDDLPRYVKGTKPETMLSYTLEAMIGDADACVVVLDSLNIEQAAYAFNLARHFKRPLYWVNPSPVDNLNKYAKKSEKAHGRWLIPGDKGYEDENGVIEAWKKRRRY